MRKYYNELVFKGVHSEEFKYIHSTTAIRYSLSSFVWPSNSSLTSFWYLALVCMCSSLLGADDSEDNGTGVSNSAAMAF